MSSYYSIKPGSVSLHQSEKTVCQSRSDFSADRVICPHIKDPQPVCWPLTVTFLKLKLVFSEDSSQKAEARTIFGGWGVGTGSVPTQAAVWTRHRPPENSPCADQQHWSRALTSPGIRPWKGWCWHRNVSCLVNSLVQAFPFGL